MIDEEKFREKLFSLPNGSYSVYYHDKRYALIKSSHFDTKLIKLYAKELGDNDFISLNYYPYLKDGLKPCEMSINKVVSFVMALTLIKD